MLKHGDHCIPEDEDQAAHALITLRNMGYKLSQDSKTFLDGADWLEGKAISYQGDEHEIMLLTVRACYGMRSGNNMGVNYFLKKAEEKRMKTDNPFQYGYEAKSDEEMQVLKSLAKSLGHGVHNDGWGNHSCYPVFCSSATLTKTWQPSQPNSTNDRCCKKVASFVDMVKCMTGGEFELAPEPKTWTVGCNVIKWDGDRLKADNNWIPRDVIEDIWGHRPWKDGE